MTVLEYTQNGHQVIQCNFFYCCLLQLLFLNISKTDSFFDVIELMILGFLFGSCRICKCLGTSFLVYKGGFVDKNQDKHLYPFASLTA